MPHIPAESEFLCESCGYIIAGLAADGPCPECGKPISESLPDRRTGSPWQLRRSVTSWAATNALMLMRPMRVFDRVRMDSRRTGLLKINLLVAAILISLAWTAVLIGDPSRNARLGPAWYRSLMFAASLSIQVVVMGGILAGLTAIEARGIRFFGTRRGWRITRAVAWQVCGHASVGWIIAAILTLLSLIAWLNFSSFGLTGWLERRGTAGSYILALVPLSGFLVGMLVFETLVYLGMRRCRFANAPAALRPPLAADSNPVRDSHVCRS